MEIFDRDWVVRTLKIIGIGLLTAIIGFLFIIPFI
jgi:hypothetical protein